MCSNMNTACNANDETEAIRFPPASKSFTSAFRHVAEGRYNVPSMADTNVLLDSTASHYTHA